MLCVWLAECQEIETDVDEIGIAFGKHRGSGRFKGGLRATQGRLKSNLKAWKRGRTAHVRASVRASVRACVGVCMRAGT
eukprot:365051-Chlamydomonas_euryale.AAC.13